MRPDEICNSHRAIKRIGSDTLGAPEFEQLGFKTQWIDMSAVGRAGHLVARHAGNRGGKRLLLIGHLDTVFEADSPFQRWMRDGDRAHGPGAGDDKGGDAVIVAALRAMHAAGTLKNANITVFLTGDEEDAGRPLAIARRDLIAEGKRADVAFDFEEEEMPDARDSFSMMIVLKTTLDLLDRAYARKGVPLQKAVSTMKHSYAVSTK